MTTAPPTGRPRTPAALLFYDRAGELQLVRVLGVVVLAVTTLALGTFAALLFAGTGKPQVLGVWVLAAFVIIKIPLLATLWWVMGRHVERGGGRWARSELDEILAYLDREAQASVGRRDAAARLDYFSREAWNVADRAREEDTARAVECATRIDALAAGERFGAGPR